MANLAGSFVDARIKVNGEVLNVVSVYSPAWSIEKFLPNDVDMAEVESMFGKVFSAHDLFAYCLEQNTEIKNEYWVIAGDFNMYETIKTPRLKDTAKYIEKLNSMGLQDSLRNYSKKLTPTYNWRDGEKLINQLDYMFTSQALSKKLESCVVGDSEEIFGNKMSDHLPVIGTFS